MSSCYSVSKRKAEAANSGSKDEHPSAAKRAKQAPSLPGSDDQHNKLVCQEEDPHDKPPRDVYDEDARAWVPPGMLQYVCPLTGKLPKHAFGAQDGQIYDIDAWREYGSTHKLPPNGMVRSPVTGELMCTGGSSDTWVMDKIDRWRHVKCMEYYDKPRDERPLAPFRQQAPPETAPNTAMTTTPHDNDNSEVKPEDFVCPLTGKLPWEPVVASDGHYYEMAALEEYLKEHGKLGYKVKSPATGKPMSKKYWPSKNASTRMMWMNSRNGFPSNLAAQYSAMQDAKYRQKLLEGAEGGDLWDIEMLAKSYWKGEHGFSQDHAKAYKWSVRGHEAGNDKCTVQMALLLLSEKVTVQNLTRAEQDRKGVSFLKMAASKSEHAAMILGKFYARGSHGLPVDKVQAQQWLRSSIENGEFSELGDMRPELFDEALDLLVELKAQALLEEKKGDEEGH